jgi:hypothetical protein
MTRARLALLVGYHQNSKGFSNGLGSLRGRGSVRDYAITPDGYSELGEYEELPEGDELVEWYCANKLRPAEGRILRAIRDTNPANRNELAERVGYHPNAKSFTNGLGRLRGLGLVAGLQLSRELSN